MHETDLAPVHKPCFAQATQIGLIAKCGKVFADFIEAVVGSCFFEFNHFIFKSNHHFSDFFTRLGIGINQAMTSFSLTELLTKPLTKALSS